VAGIEPAFDGTRKTLVIFALNVVGPGFRMGSEPRFSVVLPLIAQMYRNRVSKSECDEVNSPLLLPMRQMVFRMPNVGIRIEEL